MSSGRSLTAGDEVSGGWFFKQFRIEDFVSLTTQFQIRFTASDTDPQSIVEAAVDGIALDSFSCSGEPCDSDPDDNIPGDTCRRGLSSLPADSPFAMQRQGPLRFPP